MNTDAEKKEVFLANWGVFQEEDGVHVVHLDSVHAMHEGCWCMPEVLHEDWGVMIVHRKPN